MSIPLTGEKVLVWVEDLLSCLPASLEERSKEEEEMKARLINYKQNTQTAPDLARSHTAACIRTFFLRDRDNIRAFFFFFF